MIKKMILLVLLTAWGGTSALAQQPWDWHITGGTIVDGSGAEGYKADILIHDDSIGFIGAVSADTIHALRTLDASGKIVTPGFIDVHAHGNPTETPAFQNFLAMGVTTIVLGQDGTSPTRQSLSAWFEEVEATDPSVNIAVLSGHGTLRRKVRVGRQQAREQEVDKMAQFLKQDLEDGAFGMSTGLEYVPGLYADKDELIELAKIVGRYQGIIMSHMRSEDDDEIKKSITELAQLGDSARVHASHLKVVYGKGKKRAAEILRQIKNYRTKGIAFSADTYPYTASYTGIGILFPVWAKTETGWNQAMKERPAVLKSFLQQKIKKRNGPGAILFGSGTYAGQTLQQAAQQDQRSPVELIFEMGPNGASAAHFVMDEALQDSIAEAPGVMISSDGSPTMYHPRGYGSFAKVIRRYVHQKKSLSIEDAIYKMTGLPAQTLGVGRRGQLKKGNKADLLVFNPDSVVDKATFSEPHQLAEGFDWIFINGTLVREDGTFTGRRPGKILKRTD